MNSLFTFEEQSVYYLIFLVRNYKDPDNLISRLFEQLSDSRTALVLICTACGAIADGNDRCFVHDSSHFSEIIVGEGLASREQGLLLPKRSKQFHRIVTSRTDSAGKCIFHSRGTIRPLRMQRNQPLSGEHPPRSAAAPDRRSSPSRTSRSPAVP